jgi:hypothetical protein
MKREYDFSEGIRGKHAGKGIRIIGDPRSNSPRSRKASTDGKTNADIADRFFETKEVLVSWVHEDTEGYIYKSVPGTIVANRKAESLRFELTEKNSDGENFEVIIRSVKGLFMLKADHPVMKNREYSLKLYSAPDEVVFYLQDEANQAYFHLSW